MGNKDLGQSNEKNGTGSAWVASGFCVAPWCNGTQSEKLTFEKPISKDDNFLNKK